MGVARDGVDGDHALQVEPVHNLRDVGDGNRRTDERAERAAKAAADMKAESAGDDSDDADDADDADESEQEPESEAA